MSARGSVVFVPGFMQRAGSWVTVARTVSDGRPVSLLDFEAWTWEERLAELRAAGGPGSALVGYSMGGRLVLHAALRDPGRYAALVLLGAHAGLESGRAERRRADEELADWIERRPIEEVVRRWEEQPVFASQGPELRRRQRPDRLAHDPGSLAALLRTGGQGAVAPVWERLGELRMPVLLLAGALDVTYVDAGRRMAALLPRGRAATVAGAGHAAHLEDPAATARVIAAFLDEALPAPRGR